ncbi:barstar family protein [Kitasatospora sp. McL0602]|uniref:barstar family protein n=1 Tax=Kitasatospora sp. McL0602 TaxID=3439530 RepID=UPI003F89E651
MAAFPPDVSPTDPGYRLMRNGPVTLVRAAGPAVARLTEAGYQVVRLPAGTWATPGDLHRDIAAALHFPAYYGRNLDALNDCLRDVLAFEYGASPTATGLVLVLDGYDRFAAACPREAWIVLDIVAEHSHRAALTGTRFLCLAQSDNPTLHVEPVGAASVGWGG